MILLDSPENLKNKTGIYTIKNTVTGQLYLGSAGKCFRKRFWEHKSQLSNGTHFNKKLLNSYIKYGAASFLFELLEEYPRGLCLGMEQYWINLLQPDFNINLNITQGGRLGRKHSAETIQKLRDFKITAETIEKIKIARAAQVISKGTIDAMGAAWRQPVTDMNGNKFNSIRAAAAFWKIPERTARNIVAGVTKNHSQGIKLYKVENS